MASLLTIQKEHKAIKRPKSTAFTYAITCYKHLAGEVGVKITEALVFQNIILPKNKYYELTQKGRVWFLKQGIVIERLQGLKRSFAH